MDATELCHRRVLPAVMIFALGVLAADFANKHRERQALAAAKDQVQQCREQLAVATLPLSMPIVQTKGGK